MLISVLHQVNPHVVLLNSAAEDDLVDKLKAYALAEDSEFEIKPQKGMSLHAYSLVIKAFMLFNRLPVCEMQKQTTLDSSTQLQAFFPYQHHFFPQHRCL